jgi:predicted RNA-binding protein with RPS1 domain
MAWIENVREKIKEMNEVTCEILDNSDDSKYIDFKAKELEYKSLKYMKSKGKKVLKVTSPFAQDVDKLKGWVFKSDAERRELLRLYLCQKYQIMISYLLL